MIFFSILLLNVFLVAPVCAVLLMKRTNSRSVTAYGSAAATVFLFVIGLFAQTLFDVGPHGNFWGGGYGFAAGMMLMVGAPAMFILAAVIAEGVAFILKKPDEIEDHDFTSDEGG